MSFYRKITWYFKGLREYTKSGFEAAAKNFDSSDLDVDLRGKIFMITGANSGIGKQVQGTDLIFLYKSWINFVTEEVKL